jgi:hypothetical protein
MSEQGNPALPEAPGRTSSSGKTEIVAQQAGRSLPGRGSGLIPVPGHEELRPSGLGQATLRGVQFGDDPVELGLKRRDIPREISSFHTRVMCDGPQRNLDELAMTSW